MKSYVCEWCGKGCANDVIYEVHWHSCSARLQMHADEERLVEIRRRVNIVQGYTPEYQAGYTITQRSAEKPCWFQTTTISWHR